MVSPQRRVGALPAEQRQLGALLRQAQALEEVADELAQRRESPDPSTRKCPECRSDIPIDARRCAFCTSEVIV